MKKIFFLVLLLTFFHVFAHAENQDQVKSGTIGIGLGYGFNSLIGDSVRPINLSFRYRMKDKHTFQLYVPFSFKRSHIRKNSDVRKETLWGIGLGYDYTFYSCYRFDFLVGIKADYRWYQSRHDISAVYPVYIENKIAYVKESEYYYWDKVDGICLIPNAGVRFSVGKVTAELLMNISASRFDRDSYSYHYVKAETWSSTWEEFYPDNDITEVKVRPEISINLSYYF